VIIILIILDPLFLWFILLNSLFYDFRLF